MKTITDIKPQVKTPTRYSIYLDNQFYCGLELETVMRHRLKVGQVIDPDELDAIQLDSERVKALDKALTFVSRSKKTKKELRDYLAKKGYTEQTVDNVLSKMEDYRFIADDDYSLDYVKSYSKSKGKRLIEMELRRKGISDRDMREAIESIGDETESAVKVAEKYLKNKQKTKENILKCYKYLLSKGFDYETAKSAVGKLDIDEDDIT